MSLAWSPSCHCVSVLVSVTVSTCQCAPVSLCHSVRVSVYRGLLAIRVTLVFTLIQFLVCTRPVMLFLPWCIPCYIHCYVQTCYVVVYTTLCMTRRALGVTGMCLVPWTILCNAHLTITTSIQPDQLRPTKQGLWLPYPADHISTRIPGKSVT